MKRFEISIMVGLERLQVKCVNKKSLLVRDFLRLSEYRFSGLSKSVSDCIDDTLRYVFVKSYKTVVTD